MMVETGKGRGNTSRAGRFLAIVLIATGWGGCARIATSGQRTAGDPEAMGSDEAGPQGTLTPFSGKLMDDNPFEAEQAFDDVPIIKHALSRPGYSRAAFTPEPSSELMPNPFKTEMRKQRESEGGLEPSTIAVRQLMMSQADADLETDLSAMPEPDFRGQGRNKRSAASSASAETELDVVGFLARQHGKIKSCYEMGLALDPSIEGKITVEFKVSRKGKVKRPKVVQSDLPRSVERCILHTLKQLDFPDQDDPSAVFEYPFFFAR